MQLELDKQVHQYDADTWFKQGEQTPQNEYYGLIHPCPDHHVITSHITPKIATTSYHISVKIFFLAGILHYNVTQTASDGDIHGKHTTNFNTIFSYGKS